MERRMSRGSQARRWIAATAVAAALTCLAGCSFLEARARDGLDMGDFGFTITPKPQFGIYANCPFLAPGGYTKVDGYYAGLGGGKLGIMEHHQDAAALLIGGHENITWKDKNDPNGTKDTGRLSVGPLGVAADAEGRPVYKPQCAHYLHLGFLGFTGNLNYKEWPDFFAGWLGWDPMKDDGRVLAHSPKEEKIQDLSARLARPQNGLQLLIRTDKEVYDPDEPILLDVQLINRTGVTGFRADKPRDLSVYFEPMATRPGGGSAEWLFKFFVFDVYSGEPRYQSPRFEVPAERRGPYYHYATLAPRSFVGRQFVLPPASDRNWLKPGVQFIIVSYEVSNEYPYVVITPQLTAYQAKALGTDTAYTKVWTGRLYSNAVTFRIQRPKLLGLF
jgi:hypothetical protein